MRPDGAATVEALNLPLLNREVDLHREPAVAGFVYLLVGVVGVELSVEIFDVEGRVIELDAHRLTTKGSGRNVARGGPSQTDRTNIEKRAPCGAR
jgi:hypothetical protein